MKVYRSNKKLKLSNQEWYDHFQVPLRLMIPVVLLSSMYINSLINSKHSSPGLLIMALIVLAVVLFLYWRNNQKLLFYEYQFKLNNEEFKELVQATARELQWHILELGNDQAIALRAPETFGDGSERITVEKTAYSLFVNSIPNPEKSSSYSAKRNRENVVTLFNNTQHIFKGGDINQIITKRRQIKAEEFWEESEWTAVKILKRMVGYGLALLFLLIAYLMIAEGEWLGLPFALVSFGLAVTYVKSDIELLMEKSKRKK